MMNTSVKLSLVLILNCLVFFSEKLILDRKNI